MMPFTRYLIPFILAFMMSSSLARASASESVSELPEDSPLVPEVIHNLADPLESRHQAELSYSVLNGDKFLNTRGIGARDSYYFLEDLAVTGAFYFYQSSQTPEVGQLGAFGVVPVTYNPALLFKLAALYQPIFGKIAVGSYIQRFRVGFEAGIHTGYDSVTDPTGVAAPTGHGTFGPLLGAQLYLPVAGRFSAMLRTEFFLHSDIEDANAASRKFWEYSLGMGFLL